jgi:hypothetical protein
MSQMIAHYDVANYAAFRPAFDDDAEDRNSNGLSLLQLWRENDRSAWALFQISAAEIATAYLEGAAGAFNALAGVRRVEFHLVETA